MRKEENAVVWIWGEKMGQNEESKALLKSPTFNTVWLTWSGEQN